MNILLVITFLHFIGFVEKQLVNDLLKECTKMYEFDHPNVLKLIGVCLDGGPAPYIIMPFMAHGSLLSYLRKERKELVLEPSTSLDEAEVVRVSTIKITGPPLVSIRYTLPSPFGVATIICHPPGQWVPHCTSWLANVAV